MTLPAPIEKSKGCLRFQLESNSLPPLKRTPTYWTLTWSPLLACGPVPTMTSWTTSFVGAEPVWAGIVGFVLRSPSPGPGSTFCAVGRAAALDDVVVCCLASSAALEA
jgi:hypothetical protein